MSDTFIPPACARRGVPATQEALGFLAINPSVAWLDAFPDRLFSGARSRDAWTTRGYVLNPGTDAERIVKEWIVHQPSVEMSTAEYFRSIGYDPEQRRGKINSTEQQPKESDMAPESVTHSVPVHVHDQERQTPVYRTGEALSVLERAVAELDAAITDLYAGYSPAILPTDTKLGTVQPQDRLMCPLADRLDAIARQVELHRRRVELLNELNGL